MYTCPMLFCSDNSDSSDDGFEHCKYTIIYFTGKSLKHCIFIVYTPVWDWTKLKFAVIVELCDSEYLPVNLHIVGRIYFAYCTKILIVIHQTNLA